MRIILFFIAFIISIPAKGQKPTDRRLAGLDTFVARVLKEWKAPGVTIAIVEKTKWSIQADLDTEIWPKNCR